MVGTPKSSRPAKSAEGDEAEARTDVRTPAGMGDASADEWRRLYDVIVACEAQGPWDWITADQTVAVQLPETGEIYYCIVLGATMSMRGIKAHPGPVGWASLKAVKDGVYEEFEDVAFGTRALMFYFADREELEKGERDFLRYLGYRFRGRNAWPLVRSFRIGHHPAPLSAKEVRELTIVIEQSMQLAEDLREYPALLDQGGPDQVLTRMVRPDTGEWVNGWTALPDELPALLYTPRVDELRAARMRRALPSAGIWGIEARYATFAIQEGRDKPAIHPPMLLCVDLESGLVLDFRIGERIDDWQALADAVLDRRASLCEQRARQH
jgi:hypothetical protein